MEWTYSQVYQVAIEIYKSLPIAVHDLLAKGPYKQKLISMSSPNEMSVNMTDVHANNLFLSSYLNLSNACYFVSLKAMPRHH